jgi:hypothetical protein
MQKSLQPGTAFDACYHEPMPLRLRAHVTQGRIVVDEPVDLPDGTEVQVEIANDSDGLDDEDRARLHAAIAQSQDEIDRGEGVPAAQLLAGLRARRR